MPLVLLAGGILWWTSRGSHDPSSGTTASSCDVVSVHTLAGVGGPGEPGPSRAFPDLPQAVDCIYDGAGVGLDRIVWRPVLVSFGTAVQRAEVDPAADRVTITTVRGASEARLVTDDYHGSPS